MSVSPLEIAVVCLVFVLVFGTGKFSGLMSDLAQGIKAFKREMNDQSGHRPTTSPDSMPEHTTGLHNTASAEKAN